MACLWTVQLLDAAPGSAILSFQVGQSGQRASANACSLEGVSFLLLRGTV